MGPTSGSARHHDVLPDGILNLLSLMFFFRPDPCCHRMGSLARPAVAGCVLRDARTLNGGDPQGDPTEGGGVRRFARLHLSKSPASILHRLVGQCGWVR